MAILSKLASSIGIRDEKPNVTLAEQIVKKNDENAVKELINNLSNKNKTIQSDCIKVLYEIGERKPSLIASYAKEFITLLDSKTNRLQWGAMTALDSLTSENPKIVYSSLAKIITASGSGSVITKDHCINILIKLCSVKRYADDVFALLIEQLKKSLPNQLPAYAENSIPVINVKNKTIFVKTLTSRLDDIEKETKRKRVEKVILLVNKLSS
jgi:hypothetical protein